MLSFLERLLPAQRRERLEHAWFLARQDLMLASRNVFRQRRRTSVSLIAIIGGVAAMLLASGFFEWNYDTMREGAIRARIGHVQITREGFADGGAADPLRYLMAESSEDRKLIEAFPQVDTLAPRLSFTGLISIGDSTTSFAGEGVDPEREKKASGALTILSGQDLSSIDANEITVGQGLADNLKLQVGQTVVLLANTGSGGINAIEVKVVGIFATITKAYDDFALRLPLKASQRLLRVTGVHTWLVLLERTSQTDNFLDKLKPLLKTPGLSIVPWYETSAADFYNKTVSLFSKQVLVVKLMIAFIIVLSISNTMMTNVRERYGEIGTLMALGDTRAKVLRRFLAEGAVLGFAGGVIGSVLGVGAARFISWVGIPMPPPPGMANSFVAGIMVTPGLVVEAILLSVTTAVLAGLYPAWKASRLNIVDALRHAR